jgi:hypothetical protein
MLRVWVLWVGEVEEREGARRRRCFDSETRTYFTSSTAEAAPPRSRRRKVETPVMEKMQKQRRKGSAAEMHENGPYLLVHTAFPHPYAGPTTWDAKTAASNQLLLPSPPRASATHPTPDKAVSNSASPTDICARRAPQAAASPTYSAQRYLLIRWRPHTKPNPLHVARYRVTSTQARICTCESPNKPSRTPGTNHGRDYEIWIA